MGLMKTVERMGTGALFLLGLFGAGQPTALADTLAWDITGGMVTALGGTPRVNGARFSISLVGHHRCAGHVGMSRRPV